MDWSEYIVSPGQHDNEDCDRDTIDKSYNDVDVSLQLLGGPDLSVRKNDRKFHLFVS